MKTTVLIVTSLSLLATHPFVAAAETAKEGPVELNAAGMDAITAGALPSVVRQVAPDARGSRTSVLAPTSLADRSTRLDFGTTAGWTVIPRDTNSDSSDARDARRPPANEYGDYSCLRTRSCTGGTDNTGGSNPGARDSVVGTVGDTNFVLGVGAQRFAPVRQGSYMLDFVHHKINNTR